MEKVTYGSLGDLPVVIRGSFYDEITETETPKALRTEKARNILSTRVINRAVTLGHGQSPRRFIIEERSFRDRGGQPGTIVKISLVLASGEEIDLFQGEIRGGGPINYKTL